MLRIDSFRQNPLSIFLALFVISCAQPKDTDFMETASTQTVTATQDFKPVVRVILPEGKGMCTGTHIAPRAVLTAAHCATDRGAYRVVFSSGIRMTYLKEVLGNGILGDSSDIALLIFSEDVGNEWTPVTYDGASYGDAVRLVGYGCEDLDSKLGTGIKRTGTNRIMNAGEFFEIATPLPAKTTGTKIIGPENLAGSCFGDSGGPMLRFSGNRLKVIGVAHAGGWNERRLISRYSNLGNRRTRNFLESVDRQYDLGLFDPCLGEPDSAGCSAAQASAGITSLLQSIWKIIVGLF